MRPPAARSRTSSASRLATTDHLRERLLLYLVLDPDHVVGNPVTVGREAIRGGVTAIQLRCKHGTDRAAFNLARSLRGVTAEYGVLFLLNDRVDIALATAADGVHLGVDDLPLEVARMLGGPEFVIGYSPETDEQTREAARRGADYLGVGPVYATTTKSDAGQAIGLETVARRAAMAGIPIIGIGGITATSALDVTNAGACGVAVVSAIARHLNPESAARELRTALGR